MEYYSARELFARIKETRSCRQELERREDKLIYLWKKVEATPHLVSEKGTVWETPISSDSFPDDIMKTMIVTEQKKKEIQDDIAKARAYYAKTPSLRKVAKLVGKSHEWVRMYAIKPIITAKMNGVPVPFSVKTPVDK